MSTVRLPVVVGIDTGSSSDPAVAWALDEARSLQTDVLLLNGYANEYRYGTGKAYTSMPVPTRAQAKAAAVKVVESAREHAIELAPDVTVHTAVSDGRGHLALLDAAQRASCVVVGSRGLKPLDSFFLGSVGIAVAARADCPVLVTREQPAAAVGKSAVVVGVDSTDRTDTDAVLAYAFDYADRHGLGLNAVLCQPPDPLADVVWGEPTPPGEPERLLSEALAGWHEKYPSVSVNAEVVREHPGPGLVSAAVGQHLLVVGTRGRGAMAGTLLGSVSQAALHHASCPVAVVPGS